MPDRTFAVPASPQSPTLAAALRQLAGGLSWADAKRHIAARRVTVNGTLCLDDSRRLKSGDVIALHEQSRPPVPRQQSVRIIHRDADLIVVDKPAGVQTLRRHEEARWSEDRKARQPTLDELLARMLGEKVRVRAVHRLDRDTSGLMLFALSDAARHALVRMFKKHAVERTYLAVALGLIAGPMRIETWIARDRGDGLRGSVPFDPKRDPPEAAQQAITHVGVLERIAGAYTSLECRLETGRTHQIRIHLAELGHMLCGEKLYLRPSPAAPVVYDDSEAPRQALHSYRLRFDHPITGQPMYFTAPIARDLGAWLGRLRRM